jgi:uncharacterized OsmC-like protein
MKMPLKTVEVSANLKDKYEIELKARDFSLTIDQPKPMGNDQGPTPLEYFFFALAGCVLTIGRMVALQKKIDLKAMDVKIEGDLDTDVLSGKSNHVRPGFTRIKVITTIDAPLTQEEKEAFIKEVDSRCPISDNIENVSHIEFVVS